MLKRILVPLDGSPEAEAALPLAAHLARATHGTIVLVRAIRALAEAEAGLIPADEWAPAADPRERDEASAYLRQIADDARLAGLPVDTIIATGPATAGIIRAAHSQRADLVVMTSRERSGLARWMLGSVARDVLRRAEMPVLILRATEGHAIPAVTALAEPGKSKRVLVALDGSPLAETALTPALQLAAALSAPEQASIDLLRVVELVPTLGAAPHATGVPGGFGLANDLYVESARAAREYLSGVADRLRRQEAGEQPAPSGSITQNVVLSADVASTIAATAEGHDTATSRHERERSDLIALATHGRSGLRRLILGSVAERVLDSTALPVLAVPPTAEAANGGDGQQA